MLPAADVKNSSFASAFEAELLLSGEFVPIKRIVL
jgi:hypothetical protein